MFFGQIEKFWPKVKFMRIRRDFVPIYTELAAISAIETLKLTENNRYKCRLPNFIESVTS